MGRLPRSLDAVLLEPVSTLRQMAFVAGPRQVGKTTVCRLFSGDVHQVVLDMPAVASDCFHRTEPTVVPARTFLAQLP